MGIEIRKIWTDDEAIYIEAADGRVGKEFFDDYPNLRKASKAQRQKFRVNFDGIRWDEIDEDLSIERFFDKKRDNAVRRTFRRFPVLNASAVARALSIPQPLFAAYVSGAKRPSAARERKILDEIARIGREIAKAAV